MSLRSHSCFVLVALLAAGCGGSSSGGGTGGQAGAGGTTGTGATGGTGPSCEGIFQLCCDAQGNKVNQICQGVALVCPPGSTNQPGGPDGPCPKPGQCSASKPCSADQYCDYPDNKCGSGAGSALGDCKPRPQACDANIAPVCTCNGDVQSNECTAYSSGSDLNASGACAPPSGEFACGEIFCAVGTQYCLASLSDVGGSPDTFSCKAIPSSCGTPADCACLANEPCGTQCQADAAGNLTITCAGG